MARSRHSLTILLDFTDVASKFTPGAYHLCGPKQVHMRFRDWMRWKNLSYTSKDELMRTNYRAIRRILLQYLRHRQEELSPSICELFVILLGMFWHLRSVISPCWHSSRPQSRASHLSSRSFLYGRIISMSQPEANAHPQTLPFQQVKHAVSTLDAQPSSEAGGIIILVTGALLVRLLYSGLKFTSTYHAAVGRRRAETNELQPSLSTHARARVLLHFQRCV